MYVYASIISLSLSLSRSLSLCIYVCVCVSRNVVVINVRQFYCILKKQILATEPGLFFIIKPWTLLIIVFCLYLITLCS